MRVRAEQLMRELRLEPHPEGGHYRVVYRSRSRVAPSDGRGDRTALTTIYFLLVEGEVSCWHRVRSDEAWHYYEGDPLELFTMEAQGGDPVRHLLGSAGPETRPVHVVPADAWQAARTTGAYTLVGCTVGPGFEFDDFSLLRENPEQVAPALRRQPGVTAFL
ncbi:MAG TPA: cupin domain-containing protein [Vicinamibacterales bacterium]|nr:cupin domain-containing protein [Vicinamibacterales bacterium]